jgi:hypothetical protein
MVCFEKTKGQKKTTCGCLQVAVESQYCFILIKKAAKIHSSTFLGARYLAV